MSRQPSPPETPAGAVPAYELRARHHGPIDMELEVWQLSSSATPQVTAPLRVAGLRGRNLNLVEHRVLRRLAAAGLKLPPRRRDVPSG
jgi:hypothetical protein